MEGMDEGMMEKMQQMKSMMQEMMGIMDEMMGEKGEEGSANNSFADKLSKHGMNM